MNGLNQQIQNNINSIIYQRYASGVEALSMDKLIKYISKKFKIDVDENTISDILSNNKNVQSIVDNKIVLGSKETEEKENVSDEIHDNAVNQAVDNLKQESVADALNSLRTGIVVDSTKIQLDENNVYYPLHQGSKKENKNYIVGTIIPKQDLKESVVRCKIEGTGMYIDLPIICFVK